MLHAQATCCLVAINAAAAAMKEAGVKGCILKTTSALGRYNHIRSKQPMLGLYAAGHAAAESLVQSAALAYAADGAQSLPSAISSKCAALPGLRRFGEAHKVMSCVWLGMLLDLQFECHAEALTVSRVHDVFHCRHLHALILLFEKSLRASFVTQAFASIPLRQASSTHLPCMAWQTRKRRGTNWVPSTTSCHAWVAQKRWQKWPRFCFLTRPAS